jgi:hypothetical protein
MEEALDNARQELKRVDHLFYVSLKYTRTADMIRHMIERLISTFSFGIDSLLEFAKAQKKINELPGNPIMRSQLVMSTFQSDDMSKYMALYLKLRKIMLAEYSKREEYRRHVTMTSVIDNGEVIEVDIDTLKEYYDTAKNFTDYVSLTIKQDEK